MAKSVAKLLLLLVILLTSGSKGVATYDPLLIAEQECLTKCEQPECQSAGASELTICMCGESESGLLVFPPLNCFYTCDVGVWCGENSDLIKVYAAGDVNFTLTTIFIDRQPRVAIKNARRSMVFTVDLGHGAPPVTLAGMYRYSILLDTFLTTGYTVLTVTASVPGTSLNHVKEVRKAVTNPDDYAIDILLCPLIVEPDVEYFCEVAITAVEDQVFVAGFQESFNFTPLAVSEFHRVGDPPPLHSSSVVAPSSSLAQYIVKHQEPVTVMGYATALEVHTSRYAYLSFVILRPTCSVGVYCLEVGGCMASCPYEPIDNVYSCQEPQLLCTGRGVCTTHSFVGPEVCSVSQEVLGFTQLVRTILLADAGYNSFPFARKIPVQPGDVFGVKGYVSRSLEESAEGDTVDDVLTSFHHHFSVVVQELHPFHISHTCSAINEDQTLRVQDQDSVIFQRGQTKCARNITDLTLKVSQLEADLFNSSLNVASPFYARSDLNVTHNVIFSVAGPIMVRITHTPDIGQIKTFNSTDDFPLQSGPHQLAFSVLVPVPGVYTVMASAENQHNVDSGPLNTSISLVVLHPVLDTWTVEPDSADRAFILATHVPMIRFSEATLGNFPTNAFVLIQWGDETSETLPFTHTGDLQPVFTHTCTQGGLYHVSAYIFNQVSGHNLSCQVLVVEEVKGFHIETMFYRTLDSIGPSSGYGTTRNMFPLDRNISFFPYMAQGTVDQYIVENTATGVVLLTHQVDDPFHPTLNPFHYHHGEEGKLHLTVWAKNTFQTIKVGVTVEVVAMIRGAQIDDFSEVTAKNEEKVFQITFESIGGEMCVAIDWGDKTPLATYGDLEVCSSLFPWATHNDDVQPQLTMNLIHTYVANGLYNVTLMAYNSISQMGDELSVIVTDVPCKPPRAGIVDGVLFFTDAPKMTMGTDNYVATRGSLDCGLTFHTKLRWQIFNVSNVTGDTMAPVFVREILPSWNLPILTIPARFLSYGYYLIIYTITMWDPGNLDTRLPFQNQASTYIQIIESDLAAILLEGAVSHAHRGMDDVISFEPTKYSLDPDFLDKRFVVVQWRCRRVGEDWPQPEEDFAKPVFVKGSLSTGCFGYGPGRLALDTPGLQLLGGDFLKAGDTYEMEATVTMGHRFAVGRAQVLVQLPPGPVITLRCAGDNLCRPFKDGIYLNPSYRAAVASRCTSDCVEPLQYRWTVTDEAKNPFPLTEVHTPVGVVSAEFSLSTQFYEDNPQVNVLHVSVIVTNGESRIGSSTYFMYMNQIPAGGVCFLTHPERNRALLDVFNVTCSGWFDPEGIGISSYVVTLYSPGGPPRPMVSHLANRGAQVIPLVFPPGTFDVEVTVTDKWGAFATVIVESGLEITMPTKEEYVNADLGSLVQKLQGSGDVEMLTMTVTANAAVAFESEWMSLSGTPEEEQTKTLLQLSEQTNTAAKALSQQTSFDLIGPVTVTSNTMAEMMSGSTADPLVAKSIDIKARNTIIEAVQAMVEGIEQQEVIAPRQLQVAADNIASITSNLMLSIGMVVSDQNCTASGPSDLHKSDDLTFDTDIGTDIYMEIPVELTEIRKCNVRDVSKDLSAAQIPVLDGLLTNLSKAILRKSVVDEEHTLDGRNGIFVKTGLTVLNGSSVEITLGTRGAKITLPEGFCPTGKCNDTVGYAATVWPYPTHTYIGSADNLAFGSNIVDLKFMDRELSDLRVEHTEDPIVVVVPRTLDRMGVQPPSGPEFVNSTEVSDRTLPIIYSKFSITRNDSSVNIEITPHGSDHRLFLILSSSLMPTLTHHMWFSMVEDIPVKRNDTYDWFLPSAAINGTASYYLGVGEFQPDFDVSLMGDPVRNNVSLSSVQNVSVDYSLQVLTSGCYYFDEDEKEWMGKGLEVVHSDRDVTRCEAHHLTSFGAGFFVMPNTVDFDYVFANMGFQDNLTIYVTLIITLTTFIVLVVWGRHKDKLDVRKLGATPLPDNRAEDKYLYEVLVFTGNKKEAQTDSNVYFVLSGEEDETAVRGLCDGQRNTFRKDGTDVFVMAVPRPLGPLLYLRIWHDNSGKGTNASWYLRYIVFRDVQTGDKYEFIANQWLAVEWDDGEIDRLLPVATGEQRTQFRHMFDTTSNKNLADSHLWFSIFLRPHRSRFTRCQRVGSCFALLFLSMLVNAMWYDRVPEQPTPGLKLGFFSLSPEEIGVGVMGNLIVFPPSFLIVFMFRKARPRHLRKSRIELALKRDSEKVESSSSSDPAETRDRPQQPDQPDSATSANIIHKKQKKKKMTLPWWFSLLAWALVLACIVISCFFLLMYGVMFGNSKTTKWITALTVSFFSSVLFMEPVKIFLLAMLMSVVFKSPDLDEDDVEEDEEEPNLVQDEAWLHSNTERRKRPYIPTMIDEKALQTLRTTRQREVKMYSIFKEMLIYTLFMWIVLILSHGNRDPNAFFLQRTLREAFLNEGARDNTDFTKVTNSDRLWRYLQNGFLHRLRADVLYNGKAPYRLRGFLGDQNNRIMGYGTIRQIRVRNNTCRLPNHVTRLGVRCNGYSSLEREDSHHYCLGWASPSPAMLNTSFCDHSYFRYTTAAQLDNFPVWGARDWYGGGGYVIRLRGRTEALLQVFHFLQENHWIDEMTRAVIIEFSSYNANVNLFGLSRIMAEFTPGGGITPTFSFEGINLLQHHKSFGSFILVCEVAFIAFVIFYMVREVGALCRAPASYCRDYWSYAEVAIILACYAAIVIYVLRYLATSAVLSEFNKTFGNGYVNLQYAALLNEVYLYLVSFILFVGILKFIKLLRFNKRIGILSMTLRQCWEDLKGFLFAFLLCFFSFVAMFYLMLNKHLQGFYNFITAVESCFSMMLGKFHFEKMKEVSLVVPVMFFIFVLFNSWVIVNLLLTIIIRTFMEVRHSARNQPSEYEMVKFVWGRFKSVLMSGGRSSNGSLSANPPTSTISSSNQDVERSESEAQVQELPRKVDKFLEYVNSVYFNGSLDYSSKTCLQSTLYGSKTSSQATTVRADVL